MSVDQRDAPPPKTRSERRLAIGGIALFAALLLLGIALWMRNGEEIYISRIMSAIASCF